MPVAARPLNMELIRNIDLLVLLVALPVFIAIGAPVIGWAVAGGAWIAGRIGMGAAARKRRHALAAANRNAALGVTAAAVMGRVWLLAIAILLVGLLYEREAGLAAALLGLALVTAHLGASFLSHVLDPEADGSLR